MNVTGGKCVNVHEMIETYINFEGVQSVVQLTLKLKNKDGGRGIFLLLKILKVVYMARNMETTSDTGTNIHTTE